MPSRTRRVIGLSALAVAIVVIALSVWFVVALKSELRSTTAQREVWRQQAMTEANEAVRGFATDLQAASIGGPPADDRLTRIAATHGVTLLQHSSGPARYSVTFIVMRTVGSYPTASSASLCDRADVTGVGTSSPALTLVPLDRCTPSWGPTPAASPSSA